MRLKLFTAPTIAAAMAAVRAELGRDALILNTRRTAGGVEVTAALEPEPEPGLPPPPDPSSLAALSAHGVPAALRESLAQGDLTAALAATFRFGALKLGAYDAPVMLTGPPGAGKTLTAARLAARLVMAGLRPLVVSADGRRAGASEQLSAFTRLLDVPLMIANEPVALARALARRRDGAPVLIDTAGTDVWSPEDMGLTQDLARAAEAQVALVQPAGLDPNEAADAAAAHVEAGAVSLIVTRLDLCRRLGSVLAAAQSGLTLTEAGIGPGVADGLIPLTPALLAGRLTKTGLPATTDRLTNTERLTNTGSKRHAP